MKAGTLIELPDGRRGVVLYHGLDGYGVRLGKERLTQDELQMVMNGTGVQNVIGRDEIPGEAYWLIPNAMLRDPYPSADCECVGTEFKILNSQSLYGD